VRIDSPFRRVLRWLCLALLALYLVCALGILSVRYLVLPGIDDYRPTLERMVSRALNAPVRIGRVGADWQGLNPELQLSDVTIQGPDGQVALSLPKVDAVISWRSVFTLAPRMRQLVLTGPMLDIRRDAQGAVWIAGLPIDDGKAGDGSEPAIARWLVDQDEIVIRGAGLRWTDAQRGAPPLAVEGLHAVLRNQGHHHRLAVRATPPADLAAPIDLRADFTHSWFADSAANVRRWRGEAYLALSKVDLAAWRPWVDLPADVKAGRGALTAWVGMERGRVVSLTADLGLEGLDVGLRSDLPRLDIARAGARLQATRTEHDEQFALQSASVTLRDGLALTPGAVTLRRVKAHEAVPAGGELRIDRIDLASVTALARRLPLDAAWQNRLARMDPRGTLGGLALNWAGWSPQAETLTGSGRLDDIALAPAPVPTGKLAAEPQRPGVEHLSGSFTLASRRLNLQIDARQPVFNFPGVFADPVVPFESLKGSVQVMWPANAPLRVEFDKVQFVHARLAGRGAGAWQAGGKSPGGILELAGTLDYADARDVHRFMPLEINADIRSWLRRALVAGRLQDAQFRVRGDLRDFPYRKPDTGEFKVSGKLTDVTLDYAAPSAGGASPWPRIEGIAGNLIFDRTSMRLVADRATARVEGVTGGIQLGRTVAGIDSLDERAQLKLEATPSAPAAAFLRFVAQSPLRQMIGGFLDDARISGDVKMPLALTLPLAKLQDTLVDGSVEFSGNEVLLLSALPPLEHVTGRMSFNNDGIAMPRVEASFLGGPIAITGTAPAAGRSLLRLEGNVGGAAISRWGGLPLFRRLSGNTPYQGTVSFTQSGEVDVAIESSLGGMAVDLPAPLGKPATTALPLRVDWQRRGSAATVREQLGVKLGEVLEGLVERAPNGKRMQVQRAALALHDRPVGGAPLALPARGLAATIALKQIEQPVWQGLVAELSPPPASSIANDLPVIAPAPSAAAGRCLGSGDGVALDRVAVSLQTPELHYSGRRLKQVDLNVVCDAAKPFVWQVKINADKVAGDVTWQVGQGKAADRITARLDRFVVEDDPSVASESVFDRDSVADMPDVDLRAAQFVLYGRDLGTLEVTASSQAQGREWHMNRLRLSNPDADLAGTGIWRVDPNAQGSRRRRMELDAVLSLHDAGKFLDRVKLKGTMRGGSGTLTGRVSWGGKPYSLDIPSLDGALALTLEKGQFLKAEPGIAKLLGVMSLQALPRRITLDFRDVFSDGFAYDSIIAHAAIDNGIMRTEDFKMRGVAATVVMGGQVDLDRETQDLKVVVVPEVNAGTASILYALAVNPAIGLGTFLAQWLLRDPLNKAFTFEYAVSGGWSDPQVERVKKEGAAAPVVP
jgi:uncharacterized protein (TIGR02099 family)